MSFPTPPPGSCRNLKKSVGWGTLTISRGEIDKGLDEAVKGLFFVVTKMQ